MAPAIAAPRGDVIVPLLPVVVLALLAASVALFLLALPRKTLPARGLEV